MSNPTAKPFGLPLGFFSSKPLTDEEAAALQKKRDAACEWREKFDNYVPTEAELAAEEQAEEARWDERQLQTTHRY